MKAKKVYENISFKRGQDPYDALNVGMGYLKKKIIAAEITFDDLHRAKKSGNICIKVTKAIYCDKPDNDGYATYRPIGTFEEDSIFQYKVLDAGDVLYYNWQAEEFQCNEFDDLIEDIPGIQDREVWPSGINVFYFEDDIRFEDAWEFEEADVDMSELNESISFKRGEEPYDALGVGSDIVKRMIINGDISFGQLYHGSDWGGSFYIKTLKNIYCNKPTLPYSADVTFSSKPTKEHIYLVCMSGEVLMFDFYYEAFTSRTVDKNIAKIPAINTSEVMPAGIWDTFFLDNPDAWEFHELDKSIVEPYLNK